MLTLLMIMITMGTTTTMAQGRHMGREMGDSRNEMRREVRREVRHEMRREMRREMAHEGYRHCAPAPVYHHRPHHYAARPVHVVYEPVPVPAPRPCPPPAYCHADPAGVVAGAVVGTALCLMIGSLAY